MNGHVYSFLLFVSSKPHYHAEFKCIVSVLLAESPKRIHRACSENRTRPEVAILVLTKMSAASDNQKQIPTWTACCRHKFNKILILHMHVQGCFRAFFREDCRFFKFLWRSVDGRQIFLRRWVFFLVNNYMQIEM